ncbi:Carbonic anhydrase 9 [Sarcoptes scabiei]|nr:Carbonic anhydrase 9 [Sarcoptes scabiei]
MKFFLEPKNEKHFNALYHSVLVILFSNFVQVTWSWSYQEQVQWPYDRSSTESNQCDGLNQSPINIPIDYVHLNRSMKLSLINYDRPTNNFLVNNNGHSVQFDYVGHSSAVPKLTGSALRNRKYRLAQLHFHWGSSRHQGSEHQINHREFPAEMHLVHFDEKYPSLTEALRAMDGSVTVLGVFIKIKNYNPDFEPIANILDHFYYDPERIERQLQSEINLKKFLPKQYERFYRYRGSLTTPPCTEGLIWLVLSQPIEISSSQLKKFWPIFDPKTGDKLANNFRDLQDLNDRLIESSFEIGH